MVYIGITRGQRGTIGIIPEDGEPKFFSVPITQSGMKTRLNKQRFIEIMKPYAAIEINECQKKVIAKAVVEEPVFNKTRFRETVFQTRFFEAITSILELLGISVETVQPLKWHNQLFIGKYRKSSAKQASLDYAKELYPQFIQCKQFDRFGICLADWLYRGIKYEYSNTHHYE